MFAPTMAAEAQIAARASGGTWRNERGTIGLGTILLRWFHDPDGPPAQSRCYAFALQPWRFSRVPATPRQCVAAPASNDVAALPPIPLSSGSSEVRQLTRRALPAGERENAAPENGDVNSIPF
jgi:hypothetical protein